jgi:BTB/POZ domain
MTETSITNASVASLVTDLRSLINNPASFPDVTFIVGAQANLHSHSNSSSMASTGGSTGFEHAPSGFGGGLGSSWGGGDNSGGSGSAMNTILPASLLSAASSLAGAGVAAGSSGGVGGSGQSSAHGGGSGGSNASQTIYAHKAILAARCEHFRAMFTSGMKESAHGAAIEYPEWSSAAFLSMLSFIYTGSIQGLSSNVAVELLALSDRFGLDGLRVLAETALTNVVDASNVFTLISHAHRFGASNLKAFCLDYIVKQSEAVSLDALDVLADTPTLLIEITKLVLSRKKGT